MNDVTLYIAGRKGVRVLEYLLNSEYRDIVTQVVYAHDSGCMVDNAHRIIQLCEDLNVSCTEHPQYSTKYNIAIGWRKMLHVPNLIVFHDSLLPKYRGFAPLVTAMINGDTEVGATVFYAADIPDAGDIIFQEAFSITYPAHIAYEIERMASVYVKILDRILHHLSTGIALFSEEQVGMISHSIWRTEEDYVIDWDQNSDAILRFIHAVGFPYQGASTLMNGKKVRILAAIELPDEHIVIRKYHIGKTLRLQDGAPIVICKQGLLKLVDIIDSETRKTVLPLKHLKTRFK